MTLWIYNKASQRYHVTAEGADALGIKPGTFVGQASRVELRDAWTDAQKAVTDKLARDYDNGRITLSEWVTGMRQENRVNYVEQYLLGKGGRNNMTQADWGRIGNAVRHQNEYLQNFANDLMTREPPLTLAQIEARSRMYVDGSTAMYERANALAKGMPDLPAYPGDGQTQCQTNCKCHWQIVEKEATWEATWILEPAAEHCDDCIANAGQWAPLVVAKAN